MVQCWRSGVLSSTGVLWQVRVHTGTCVGCVCCACARAQQLAKQNATVVLGCRSEERCRDAVVRIHAAAPWVPVTNVIAASVDLSDLASVKAFANNLKGRFADHGIDVLVNNGGIMFAPHGKTAQGFEMTFGVNHLAHMYLTQVGTTMRHAAGWEGMLGFGVDRLPHRERVRVQELLPLLRKAAPSRVINVASRAHERAPSVGIDFDDLDFEHTAYGIGEAAYAQSKLANMLHARKLAQLYGKDGITVVSLHPGVVNNGEISSRCERCCWHVCGEPHTPP
jgi:NAD(P)-dependent dehydrogenase (short-subunit alcohol dehydrogenase family)